MNNIESKYNSIHTLLSDINLNNSVENEIQEIIDTYIKTYMTGKKIAFRCTGAHSMELLKKFKQHGCTVNMFFDKNSGIDVDGIPVYNPDIIKKSNFDYIVIATANFKDEIKEELKNYGINSNKIIDIYEVLKNHGYDLRGVFYEYKSGSYEIPIKFYNDYLESEIVEEKQRNLYNYIVSNFEIYNFNIFFKYAELYIKEKYEKWDIISEVVSKTNELLNEIRIIIEKRKEKDIFVYWTDAVQQNYLKYMPYILNKKKSSISFENTYSITPYTHQIMRAMFSGIKPIDDYEKSKELISEGNSIVIDDLLKEGYKIKHIGHDGYINFSISEEYRIDFNSHVAMSVIFWRAISELIKSEKPTFFILHSICETHPPCLCSELEQCTYGNAIVKISQKQIEKSYKASSDLIGFYDEIINNDNMYKIYMSDHGNHFEIPQWYWAQNKIKPYFFISNSKIKQAEYYDIFSYTNFHKVVKWIIYPEKNDLKEAFSEYSHIQDVDIFNRNLVRFFISKGIQEYAMSYRGVVTSFDKYVLRADGKEFYYEIDKNNEERQAECEKSRLEYLRSISGNKFIDIYNDDKFKYSRLLYK